MLQTTAKISEHELSKLNSYSSGEYVMKTYTISLALTIISQCTCLPNVKNAGQQLIDLIDLAQAFSAETQAQQEGVNDQCLKIYQSRDDSITDLISVYKPELRNFRQGLSSYQDFYDIVYVLSYQVYFMQHIGLMYQYTIQMISRLASEKVCSQ